MITEGKCKWLLWTVVVLAILNLSTIGSIIYHNRVAKNTQSFKKLEADTEHFSGRYFKDKLKLDAGQMESFRTFNPVFRQKARDITLNLSRLRQAMILEMASQNTDTVKLNMLADSIGLYHRDLKKETFRYYLKLKSICTAEQKKSLELLFKNVFINDFPMGHPGPRPHRRHLNLRNVN